MYQEEISIFETPAPLVYASFWQRFGALFLDGLVLAIPNICITWIIGGGNWLLELIRGEISTDTILTQLAQLALGIAYFASMESSKQQATVGKMALKIKVTDLNGERISFGQATGRYLAKVLSGLMLCIGYLMMLWDGKKQTLHDKLASTIVVSETR